MRPGTRNRVLRSSGLYQMRGSTASGGSSWTRPRRQLAANRAQDVRRVSQHGRGGVRVVAVDDDLNYCAVRPDDSSLLKPSGMTSTRAHLVQIQAALGVGSRMDRGGEVKIAGVDERGDDGAALRGSVAILDRERDVPDVEVQRVAVQQQEECRNEQQDQQRAAVAQDLPQLLPVDRQGLPHAAAPPAFSTTSRNTSSSDGSTSAISSTVRPRARSFASRSAGVIVWFDQYGVDRGPKEAGLLDLGQLIEGAHDVDRARRPHLDNRAALEDLFHLAGGPECRQTTCVDQRDAVAALRFVQIVGGNQHGHAVVRQRVDQTPELPPRQRVDAAGRLIEEENRRLVQNRAAEGQTLPPSAGQIAGERAFAPVQAGHLEHELPARSPAVRRSSPYTPPKNRMFWSTVSSS